LSRTQERVIVQGLDHQDITQGQLQGIPLDLEVQQAGTTGDRRPSQESPYTGSVTENIGRVDAIAGHDLAQVHFPLVVVTGHQAGVLQARSSQDDARLHRHVAGGGMLNGGQAVSWVISPQLS
jgi:hypothetical protein